MFFHYLPLSLNIIDQVLNSTLTFLPAFSQRVGCDGYLGSSRNLDHCGVCDGDGSTCRRITGQFEHLQLASGYHHVADLPAGATDISLRRHTASHNHLVLLDRARHPVLTGDHLGPGPYHVNAGGTEFALSRPTGHPTTQEEKIAADGPTTESLALIVSYCNQKRRLRWNSTAILIQKRCTDKLLYKTLILVMHRNVSCKSYSKTCIIIHVQHGVTICLSVKRCDVACFAEGRRSLLFGCVRRSSHERVAESLCDVTMKPTPSQETCNTQPCPAYWDSGEWSVCSRTCGPGVQLRQVLCRQMVSGRDGTVPPSRCSRHPRPETSMICQERICSQWHIRQEWSSCSVPCGRGQRRRHVACVSNQGDVVEDSECNRHLRPRDLENCDLGPCARAWFFTEWSAQCSSTCSEGVRTRSVLCLSGHKGGLPLEACGVQRPQETKPCGPFPCRGLSRWFTGLWDFCPSPHPPGFTPAPLPLLIHWPTLAPLPAFQCSRTCGGGTQEREVRCLDDAAQPSDGCTVQRQPEKQQPCNTQACPDCVDKFPNCPTVARAQLCLYPYYRSACCASCSLPPRPLHLIHRHRNRHHLS
uniref:PLAC domain-containing protein n=1 Tax=Eptatretus burgeri TaxID=7764 RepID=A0A8C4R7H6_EPTBU